MTGDIAGARGERTRKSQGLLLLAVVGWLFAATPSQADVSIVAATAQELAVLELTNAERTWHGLGPLEFDYDLLDVARVRAHDQVGRPGLFHVDASGELVCVRLIRRLGLAYRVIGENLALVPGPESSAPELAVESLMNSPTHRANILEPSFDRMAVGSVTDASGRVIFAQIFRAPS